MASVVAADDSLVRVAWPAVRRRAAQAAVALLGLALFVCFAAADRAAGAACPNEAVRASQVSDALPAGTVGYPECMALELVTPPGKFGQFARNASVAAGGSGVRFESQAALAGTPNLTNPFGDRYVAVRGAAGWAVHPTTAPGSTSGVSVNAFAFLPDFSAWAQMVWSEHQIQRGGAEILRQDLDGGRELLAPPLVAATTIPYLLAASLQGSTDDLSVFGFDIGSRGSTYLAGDPATGGPLAEPNAYIASLHPVAGPRLELLARDHSGVAWGAACGATIGGLTAPGAGAPLQRNQGAVSERGILFTTRPSQPAAGPCDPVANRLRILLRTQDVLGNPQIAQPYAPECDRLSPACDGGDGDDYFQGASRDGSSLILATTRQLADTDLDPAGGSCDPSAAVEGCDLYLYDGLAPEGERLTQISAGEDTGTHQRGAGARVLNGTVAISTDGSHVYFAAEGALTGANAEGQVPASTPGARNLYAYVRDDAHPAGRLSFVATLAAADAGALWGGYGSLRNNAYAVPVLGPGGAGDGHVLVFGSLASLTADDLDGGRRDLFRYDSQAEALERVSLAAPGGSDNGPVDVEARIQLKAAGPDFAEDKRWVSEDGETVVFRTAEPLVSGDDNGGADSYLARDGKLVLVPGTGDGADPSRDAAAISHDGSTVAFESYERLLGRDGDSGLDIYVLRAGGGFAEPPEPEECVGDACQGVVTLPTVRAPMPTASPRPGNPVVERCRRGFMRGGDRCVPRPCRRGAVRRKGRCAKRTESGRTKTQQASGPRRGIR